MQHRTDNEIENMERNTILTFLQKHKITANEEDLTPLSELKEKLKKFEEQDTSRYQDTLAVLKHKHMMMGVSCIYDKAAFFTIDEYEAINGTPMNIQSLIENAFICKLVRC